MITLLLAGLTFIVIHVGVSGSAVRTALVGRVGLPAYMAAFSVASVAAMAWLVASYNTAPYVPTWGMLEWWKPFQLVLMLPAFLLVVIGLTSPNPTSFGQEKLALGQPTGIVRITRHPFLMGVAVWALVHLAGNGDWASLLFFGALAAVCIAGAPSIDAKRRQVLGPVAWDAFARRTSIIPFAAILAGRNTLVWPELAGWRPVAGLVAYVLMLGGHVHLFGVNPLPW